MCNSKNLWRNSTSLIGQVGVLCCCVVCLCCACVVCLCCACVALLCCVPVLCACVVCLCYACVVCLCCVPVLCLCYACVVLVLCLCCALFIFYYLFIYLFYFILFIYFILFYLFYYFFIYLYSLKFSKLDLTSSESLSYFTIFRENYILVEQFRLDNPNATFQVGVTSFFDMSVDEFRSTYLMPKRFVCWLVGCLFVVCLLFVCCFGKFLNSSG